jgi:hypothetical protein
MSRRESIGFGLLLSLLALLLVTAVPALAAPNINEKGTLIKVEERGSVVVISRGDHTGAYRMSPYAIILSGSGTGKKTTLDTYLVPTPVEYDVEYTATGPIIKRIREIPQ